MIDIIGLDISKTRAGIVLLTPHGAQRHVTLLRSSLPHLTDADFASCVLHEVKCIMGSSCPVRAAVEVNYWPRLKGAWPRMVGGGYIRALIDCVEMQGRVLQLLDNSGFSPMRVQASAETKQKRRRRMQAKYADAAGIKAWTQDEIDALAVADRARVQMLKDGKWEGGKETRP